MKSVLLTAFHPFDEWKTNSSELCLNALMQEQHPRLSISKKSYPIDFDILSKELEMDLLKNYDYVLSLGQSSKSTRIELESIGINRGKENKINPDGFFKLRDDGPVAYESILPLTEWALMLRKEGIPACVSVHAGTYRCNAALYLAHYFIEKHQLKTKACFIHLPLDLSQVLELSDEYPTLPTSVAKDAIHYILRKIEMAST
jgi:pyroglutamyl-peptidase